MPLIQSAPFVSLSRKIVDWKMAYTADFVALLVVILYDQFLGQSEWS